MNCFDELFNDLMTIDRIIDFMNKLKNDKYRLLAKKDYKSFMKDIYYYLRFMSLKYVRHGVHDCCS